MNNKGQVKVGTKVHYTNGDKVENGIVKDMSENTPVSVRVVYNCAGDWKNFDQFTSALTPLRTLALGWSDEAINNL
jgi:hypothetical protein